MENSDKDDDIDIFVITKKDFVWTTRFLMVVFLLILGVYRNKNSKTYSDKICLNMLLDEDCMSLEKNLYIAHEIVQMAPIFERDDTYKQFLQKNRWIENFMVNALDGNKNYLKKKDSAIDYALIFLFKIFAFEEISKFLQLVYMKKRITEEIVKAGILRLHPFDYGFHILQIYNKKLKECGL
jgi:D-beta-D-heptose 7-phosphate kinase/D-beta-D-heptose 1-phosphate adenosyltransferase